MCVKPEFIDVHVCYKLRNSLGGYGGIKVVRVSDDLGGSSSHGRGGVVAKSAVIHSRWCVKKICQSSDEFLMAVACSSLQPSIGQSDAFEDFCCWNSYPLDQVGSGKFWGGKIYDWLKKGILIMWINFLHSRQEALRRASCPKTHFIHCLGSNRQANIRLNATLLQPRVCFLNEIVNRERSESCYITKSLSEIKSALYLYAWYNPIVYSKCTEDPWFSCYPLNLSLLHELSHAVLAIFYTGKANISGRRGKIWWLNPKFCNS